MTRGPVVGIVGLGHVVHRFWGEVPIYGTPRSYVDRVTAGGARPVLLPVDSAAGLLDTVDALVGGSSKTTSLHHQAVARPGSSWLPTAWAADGVIEAVEWAGRGSWPALGVQWHPELPDDPTGPAIFGWLTRVPKATAGPVAPPHDAVHNPTADVARQRGA